MNLKHFQKTYINTYKSKNNFDKSCSYCGKIFSTGNYRRIFCSDECREKYFPDRIPNNKWLKLRFEVLKRDNFTCQYCGRNVVDDKIKLHCDHIIPVSKNGTDELDNLITSCMECNLGKSDILLEKQQEFYLKVILEKIGRKK